MSRRIDYVKLAPKAYAAMATVERYVRNSSLEASLLELVKLRASLINGCAFCVDMHSKDARAAGESEQRLYAVAVWRETPFYSARERAALAWTEAVTLVASSQVPDELYQQTLEHFSEAELVDLTMAVVVINGWNRLAVSFRSPAGEYQPGQRRSQAAE